MALAADNTTRGAALSTENLTVSNNVGVRIDQFYSNNQPGPGWNDGPNEQRMSLPARGVVLSNNTVQACGYNCVEMGGTTHMTVSSNVFLRDTPPDMFVYGTTDIILGDVDGTSSIIGNDFNRRGEYEGGPDGECSARPSPRSAATSGSSNSDCMNSRLCASLLHSFTHIHTDRPCTLTHLHMHTFV